MYGHSLLPKGMKTLLLQMLILTVEGRNGPLYAKTHQVNTKKHFRATIKKLNV